MSSRGKIDARGNFLNLLSSTEKTVKKDYMLKYLVNKTKEDFKKQVLYATSRNLFLDSDIYSYHARRPQRFQTKTFKDNNKKNIKRDSLQFQPNHTKKSFSIGNINMLKSFNLKTKKNKINLNLDTEKEEEKDDLNIFNTDDDSKRKKYEKLDKLNTILKLIDVHEQTTQYLIIDEKEQQKLNMLRDKKKFGLYHPCITYNKNNLIYNKKYKLIYDKDKDNSFKYFNIHTHQNIKKKKILFSGINNNTDALSAERRINNDKIHLILNRIPSPIKKISSNNDSNSVSKFCETKNPEISKTRGATAFSNFSESNIFKTCSNINSAKKRVFKADIILNSKKAKNNKSKHISKVYSDILINYHKIKKELNNNQKAEIKEQQDKNEDEKNIKNLIKKKKTNIKLLTKELNLDYDTENIENINLETIINNKRNKIKERMKSRQQRILLNQVQQQVLNEDKILSKKIILENNLEKKLKSRTKKLSERLFEELTLKRKRLKHHLIGFKLQYESDYINKLMNNEVLNFDVPKSLQALLYKYKVMKYN